MSRPLKILFACAEASPLVKVGGLADVAGALPKALTKLGHEVRLIIPGYTVIDTGKYPATTVIDSFPVSVSRSSQEVARVSQTRSPQGITVYLVENPRYFARPTVYGEPDDLERFLFFSRALLEAPRKIRWQPDILHCHDWHTGAAIALRETAYDPFYSSIASVFTIHNLAYQGWFDSRFAAATGIDSLFPNSQHSMTPHLFRMMGLGIFYTDAVSTVSPTYAREILTAQYGEGLESLLQWRQDSLYGILNGIDYEEFNPASDPYIPTPYDVSSIEKKALNKAALQKRAGLPVDSSIPLLGMVSRLDEQKGLDILADALESLLAQEKVQFVLLGKGREHYHQLLPEIASHHPGKATIFLSFDLPLAQLIYAGSDLFFMPSQFEPCGLGQLIALRYGTIPVVRRTGGLADTVEDCSPDLTRGNGFVFEPYQAQELLTTTKRAITAFRQKDAWHNLIKRAMSLDFSWGRSARQYETMYQQAINVRKSR